MQTSTFSSAKPPSHGSSLAGFRSFRMV
jgi:hypothetical protein